MGMRKIADRTLNVDVKFDETTGQWRVQKELSVTGNFTDEAEAINWSKEPLDSESPTPLPQGGMGANPMMGGGMPGPVEAPMNANQPLPQGQPGLGDEPNLDDLDLDLGLGDDIEEDEELVKKSSLYHTRRFLASMDEPQLPYFNPGKTSRVRDNVDQILRNSEYDSVRKKWNSKKSDLENLDTILADSKVNALKGDKDPRKQQAWANLTNLKSKTTHQRENSSSRKQVLAAKKLHEDFDRIRVAGDLLGQNKGTTHAQLMNFSRRKFACTFIEAEQMIREYERTRVEDTVLENEL